VSPTKTAARPTLSRERVVQRALEMADDDGLEAVTIRRLATELSVTPMALYWHFKTKDELLAGLADRVLEDVVVPEPVEEWAEDLGALLTALITAMRPHPQAAQLVMPRMMVHPTGLELTERTLARLTGAGFDPERAGAIAVQALRTVLAMVTGDPVDDSVMTAAERDDHLRHKQALISSLPADRYPTLVAHAVALTWCPADTFLGTGVDLFVAGVRSLAPDHR
jgi:AcrR family transcriptional regulator